MMRTITTGLIVLASTTFLATSSHANSEKRKLYDEKCNAGESQACFELGKVFQHGYGVEKDKVKAQELHSKACELGDGRGCTNEGFLLENSEDGGAVLIEVFALYLTGCDKGSNVG